MNLPGMTPPKDNWNYDTSSAPKDGRSVLIASKCGKVIRSKWLADPQRFEFLQHGETFKAWQHWPEYPK